MPLVILRKVKNLLKEPFINNVATLVGWTAIAQGIYFIGLPIISRLYPVEAFGNLAVLQAVSSLVIIVSALRYEVAILLPGDDDTAFNLLALSLIFVSISTLIVFIGLLFISNISFPPSKYSFLLNLWWLIPLFQLGAGAYETLLNWAVRKQAFNTIGYTKITQTVSMIFLQVGLGIFRSGSMGLYVGDIFGRASGSGSILSHIWSKDRNKIRTISLKKLFYVAHKYKSFPMYSTAAVILSLLGRNFVPVAIVGIYGPNSAGLFAMASRVIACPVELLCRPFTQVYVGEAARLSNEYLTN